MSNVTSVTKLKSQIEGPEINNHRVEVVITIHHEIITYKSS